MKAKDVHSMRDEELKLEIERLRVKRFDLRTQAVTEKVEDTSQFEKLRRDIARLATEQSVRRHRAGGASTPAKAASAPAKPATNDTSTPVAKKAPAKRVAAAKK